MRDYLWLWIGLACCLAIFSWYVYWYLYFRAEIEKLVKPSDEILNEKDYLEKLSRLTTLVSSSNTIWHQMLIDDSNISDFLLRPTAYKRLRTPEIFNCIQRLFDYARNISFQKKEDIKRMLDSFHMKACVPCLEKSSCFGCKTCTTVSHSDW